MCGIAGGFWLRGVDTPSLNRMERSLHQLRFRGPDYQGYKKYDVNEGTILLGHARLSVIDISEAAHQPMVSPDGRFSIVFNGEIYNYIELRHELEQCGVAFTTNSDTEVLLAAWIAWGELCLKRFIGMFAFVIIDHSRKLLIAARDGFGIKPIYYSHESGNFCFASEISPLHILLNKKPILNWQRAYDYLVHSEYDFGVDTFYEGVMSLPAGHILTLELGGMQDSIIQKWWSPNINLVQPLSLNIAASEFRERFLQSVKIHLRSDVPVGAALSGGIDSSSIVCAMRHLEPDMPIHTFSFIAIDSKVSEENWINKVNAHVGSIPHKVSVSPMELFRDLDDLIATQGEPFGGTSIYAQYRVFKMAKEAGITVTLDGQGADEILGGYDGYPGQRIHSLLDEKRYIDAYNFLSSWSRFTGSSRWNAIKRTIADCTHGEVYQMLRQLHSASPQPSWIRTDLLRDVGVQLAYPANRSPLNIPGRRMMEKLSSAIVAGGLARLLRHGDRNSMRFSIESRLPFLTLPLADFSLGLPEEYLVSMQGVSKSLLRSAMRGIVPDEILNRTDKVGFATPERDWLLSISGSLREWLMEDLHLPFLDQSKLLNEFDQIIAGKLPFSWQVWRWLNFYQWYKGLQG